MKKNLCNMKLYTFAFAALALSLAACTNDNEVMDNGPVAAVINAEISEAVATRASGTQWDNGDAIGITGGGYTDIRYVYSNGSWTVDDVSGPILFQTPDDVDFIAYYPQGAETADITITAGQQSTVPDEQTGFTPQSQIDFLYGTGTGGVSTGGKVDFSFSHRMSRLTLNFIAGPDVKLADLSSYTLSGLSMTGSFDTAIGEAKVTDSASDLKMDATGITSSSLILFPQAVTEATLKVVLGGQNYTATLTFPKANAVQGLESGYSYKYNVTIYKEELNITKANIKPWVDASVENDGNVDATI